MAPLTDPKAPVFFRTKAAVTEIWLNDPKRLNPFDPPIAKRFARIVDRVRREPSRVVIVQGKGRAFCSGGGFDFLLSGRKKSLGAVRRELMGVYKSFLKIRELPQVTVAKIHGAVVGGGLGLALACDLRAVSAKASFHFNFSRLGVSSGMGIWPMTRALFGEAKARDLFLLGRTIDGRRFNELGGATVFARSAGALERETKKLAETLCRRSPLSLKLIKEEMCLEGRLEDHLRFNARSQARCFAGPDIMEGIAAIREKREPDFG